MRDDIEDETLHCIRDYSGALGSTSRVFPSERVVLSFVSALSLKPVFPPKTRAFKP